MKRIIYALTLSLVVAGGIVFANHKLKDETSRKLTSNPIPAAEKKAAMEKWDASPDGIKYKKWEASPAGKKVYASAAKIRKYIWDYTNMEGVVTSLSLPAGSLLGFGVMVKIDNDDYILSFGPEDSEFKQLHNLKVNDVITIKSHSVSYAPKYSYPIVSGWYVERDGKLIYKRVPRKGGC